MTAKSERQVENLLFFTRWLVQAGQRKEAIQRYRDFIQNCRDLHQPCQDYRVYFNLAQLVYNIRQEREARLRGISKDGDNDGIDMEEIEELYRTSLQCKPTLPAYLNLSMIFIKCSQPDRCIELCQDAMLKYVAVLSDDSNYRVFNVVEQCPSSDDHDLQYLCGVWTNYNIAMRQVNKLNEAIECTWKVLQLPLDYSHVQNTVNTLDRAEEEEQELLRVVCVKYGTKYNAHYVNALYNMVLQYIKSSQPQKLHFICYTEDSSGLLPMIQVREFSEGSSKWSGWWRKAEIFRPPLEECDRGWCIYLDLDTIIIPNGEECIFTMEWIHRLLHITNTHKSSSSSIDLDDTKYFFTLDVSRFRNESKIMLLKMHLELWAFDYITEFVV